VFDNHGRSRGQSGAADQPDALQDHSVVTDSSGATPGPSQRGRKRKEESDRAKRQAQEKNARYYQTVTKPKKAALV